MSDIVSEDATVEGLPNKLLVSSYGHGNCSMYVSHRLASSVLSTYCRCSASQQYLAWQSVHPTILVKQCSLLPELLHGIDMIVLQAGQ
jgi:hypothetical protein